MSMDRIKETNCTSVYRLWKIMLAVNVKIPGVPTEALEWWHFKTFMKAKLEIGFWIFSPRENLIGDKAADRNSF